jgi:hypothetical protein
MSVAGFNESIWHFLGYLHIAQPVARTEQLLDGSAVKTITIDVVAAVPPAAKPDLDTEDLSSRAILAPFETQFEEERRPAFASSDDDDAFRANAGAIRAASGGAPTKLAVASGGNGGGSAQRVIELEYDDDAQQMLDSILQLNRMADNDIVTSGDIRIRNGETWSETFRAIESDDAIRGIIAQAESVIPSDLDLSSTQDTAIVAEFVAMRDHDIAADRIEVQQSLAPGRYVDGAPSDETPAAVEAGPEIKARETAERIESDGQIFSVVTGPSHGVGAVVDTGGNEAVNAAGIRDLGGLSASIIIEGDAFLTNAIIQVNVLVDNDHAELIAAGPDDMLLGLVQTARGDGNVSHNIAEFVTHDYGATLRGAALTPTWTIDVVEGDFFSVRALTQINYLTDADGVSQSTASTFYALQTGQNQQVNLANVYGFDQYDIVIIGGDSHRANWIFQTNVVLDSDWVKALMMPDDEDATHLADAGRNSLVNEARIATYGNDGYSDINDAQRELISSIARGDGTLAPNAEWNLAGSASGQIKVLYITGDYYDINLISQTNIIIDIDQVAQLAAGADASLAAVVTGGNSALNYASIVDAGTLSGSAFLGGEAYEDSILIQANIVTDEDWISVQTAEAYVPEIIAFTGGASANHQPDNDIGAPIRICDPAQLDNPANVLM